MWQNVLLNWKTSAGGFSLVMLGLGDILTYAAKGQLSPNLQQDIAMIAGGFAGIMAKDSNVAGTASK
jgi:N-acetylneuraminic acid mutarotase